MNNTTNFNLKKPEYTDFADIQDINDNMDTIDAELAAPSGDISNATVDTATASSAMYPIPAAEDTMKVILGKIRKFFSDIKSAITGLSISGTTVTYTKADGSTGTITTQDTTYTGTSPISISGTAISHENSGVTAASKGDTSNQTPTWGETFKVPSGTVNAKGHLTSFADHTVKIPSALSTNSSAGLLRTLSNNVNQYLRGDGTWQSLKNNFITTEEGYGLDARAGKAIYDSSLYSKGSIVSFSTNLNNITAPGVYQIPGSASASNMPSGISYGTLLVIRGDTSASFFNQVLYFPSDGTVSIYTRSSVDSGATWRAWAQVTDASALDNYLKIANITQSQTVTNSGYALDARQANPNVSNSLGAKIATNATNVGTLMSNLVDLKFEHVVKTAVGTGYNSSNQLFFKGKNLSVTNYNGNGFFVILNQAPAPGDPTEGATSLYFLTFSNGNDNGYNITRITGTGYNGAGSTYYPKISVLTSGNIYVHWNALPSGQGNSANIHASIFQLY